MNVLPFLNQAQKGKPEEIASGFRGKLRKQLEA